MKMKRTLAMILLGCMVCVLAGSRKTEAEAADPAGAEKLRLVRVDNPVAMPGEAAGEAIYPKEFLGISPDGKTLLTFTSEEVPMTAEEIEAAREKAKEQQAKVSNSLPGRKKKDGESATVPTTKTVYHFCLVRDGEMIQIMDNTAFGAGDPLQRLDSLKSTLQNYPDVNSLSWSEDGRYVTLSNYHMAIGQNKASMCVPVIDTVSREAWLADWYDEKLDSGNCGWAYLSAMSRDGKYVYYLSEKVETGKGADLCFCRCATADGASEILYRIPSRDAAGFTVDSASNLAEAADGSWIMSGKNGTGEGMNGISLVRYTPEEDGWKADILPTLIPRVLSSLRFVYSPDTGYGLMAAGNQYAQPANLDEIQAGNYSSMYSWPAVLPNRINLIRFHPDGSTLYDVWYMESTGDGLEDMKMVSAEEYLENLRSIYFFQQDIPVPENYDPEEEMRNPQSIILNICMSPDGRHALLAAKTVKSTNDDLLELYLLDTETMEVRRVETPENTLSLNLAASSPVGMEYQPGMVWNPDGTIVIHVNDRSIGFFRFAE